MSILPGNYSDTSSSEDEALYEKKKSSSNLETPLGSKVKYSKKDLYSKIKHSDLSKLTPLKDCDNKKYSTIYSTPSIKCSSDDNFLIQAKDSPVEFSTPKEKYSPSSFKSPLQDNSLVHNKESFKHYSTPREKYSTSLFRSPLEDNSLIHKEISSGKFYSPKEIYSTPCYKRSFEEDTSPVHNKDSSKNVDLSNRHITRGKRSLQSKEVLSTKILNSENSTNPGFLRKISPSTPVVLYNKASSTDQTPYSPVSSRRSYKRLRTTLPYYNSSDLITFKSDHGFIDSHCHLDFLFQRQAFAGTFSEYREKHKNTFPECYEGCLAIFCNPESFRNRNLWESYLEDNVWASFGCHPHNAKDYNNEVEDSLRSALEHPKVRAVGEIGLDYSNRNNCLRTLQHEAFRRQLKIALEKQLPLVIHCREAHEDGLAIMKELVPKNYFIHLHCFTDKWEFASQWLQEFPNLYIGLTNVVTFPSAEEVHNVAKKIPLTRLLLETDSPYFIPRPLQRQYPDTKFSHPGMAIHVAAQVSALKGVKLELVLQMTRLNTKKMYKI